MCETTLERQETYEGNILTIAMLKLIIKCISNNIRLKVKH